MKSRLSRGERVTKTPSERRVQIQQTRQTNPDQKDTPITTETAPAQETMPTEMANIVFTANYRITPRKSVSKESVIRNHVKTDKAVPIGPAENSDSQNQGQQPVFH